MYNEWNVCEKRKPNVKHIFRRLGALLCAFALCLTSVSALSVEDALSLLEEAYVDPLPAAAYEAETLDDLFDAIGDPYTYYLTAEEYQAFLDYVEGDSSFFGIGVSLEYTADGLLITSVLAGGSAENAGLRADDCIIAVDGKSCVPGIEAHLKLIRGEEGTFVEVTVRHRDGSTQDYRLERRLVEIRNTAVSYENGVGYIDCNSFGSNTVDYFFGGIAAYPDAEHWVVDLRGNGGGLANAAVFILGAFTGGGQKLTYRTGDGGYSFSSYYSSRATDRPVIVLVDSRSASSSEILAGGIRAEKAGVILGSRTYGKGTAQVVCDEESYPSFFDGDALKITAYRFYNADGCTTDRIGVLPTLLVDDEYTAEAASLLSAVKPEDGEYLALTLNGIPFYLKLAEATASGHRAALSELLSALPPDASVLLRSENAAEKLAAAQALARFGDASASRCFVDVSDSPYATQIDTLGTYRILGGVGNGRFEPDATLTRAQLAALLAQALDLSGGPSGLFSDVPEGRWYTEKIGAIASLGFMDGVGGGRFEPDAALTQEQFIAVMGRLARFLSCNVDDYVRKNADAVPSNGAFASIAQWARPSADVLTRSERLNMLYTTLDEIDPQAPVTRGQAAATLCNMLKTLQLISY